MAYSNAVFYIDPENGNDTARTAMATTIASNPSGSITRMTKAAHGLQTGDIVNAASFTTWLVGQWRVTVVDADNYDLDDAVWQTTADPSGTVTPLGGCRMNDAWKSLAGVSGYAGYGSTIRIKESDSLLNQGAATWTDGSTTITWASAKNKVVCNCDDVWTASANVTASTALSASTKAGAGYSLLSPATAFTTGKLGYFTLPATLDLSAFQQLSMWFESTTARNAAFYTLKLCSDSTGDTPVHSFDFPALVAHYQAVVFDSGAALGSGINSIALYANTDPSTGATRLDNVVACKAPGAADCVTHAHVITKGTVGEPEMYALLSIADSSVELGGGYVTTVFSTGYQNRPYSGTTETVPTYTMTGFLLDATWTATSMRTYAGRSNASESELTTLSGGWSRTDMATQTGVTYFNGKHYNDSAMIFSTKSYIGIEKVGVLLCASYPVTWSGIGIITDLEQLVGCYYTSLSFVPTGHGPYRIKFSYIQGSNVAVAWGSSFYGDSPFGVIIGKRVHTMPMNRSGATGAVTLRSQHDAYIDRIDNCGCHGVTDESLTQYGPSHLHGCTISNTYKAEVAWVTAIYHSHYYDCTVPAPTFTFADKGLARLFCSRHNNSDSDHRVYSRYFSLTTTAATRHTEAGVAWKLSPTENTTYIVADAPAYFSLAKFAVNGGALVTVKCWVLRDNTGIEAGIRLLPNNIAGSPLSHTQTLMSAGADLWQQLTLTFTPAHPGVVDIAGIAWGGTTYSAYFDDITVTQE